MTTIADIQEHLNTEGLDFISYYDFDLQLINSIEIKRFQQTVTKIVLPYSDTLVPLYEVLDCFSDLYNIDLPRKHPMQYLRDIDSYDEFRAYQQDMITKATQEWCKAHNIPLS